jgi:hypothetical protein
MAFLMIPIHRSPYTGTDRRIDPCSAPQGVRESCSDFPGLEIDALLRRLDDPGLGDKGAAHD